MIDTANSLAAIYAEVQAKRRIVYENDRILAATSYGTELHDRISDETATLETELGELTDTFEDELKKMTGMNANAIIGMLM